MRATKGGFGQAFLDNLSEFQDKTTKNFGNKPTYEGLKPVPNGIYPLAGDSNKPTYEGLKLDIATARRSTTFPVTSLPMRD